MRTWSPSGPLSAIGNKVKKITLVYSYAKNRATAWYANETGSMVKSTMSRDSQTALPFVIKENEQNVRLSDSTVTVDCKDPVLLACCQCSLAHMTETLIKCQAYKAAIKGFLWRGGD